MIKPAGREVALNLREFWLYRALLVEMTLRSIRNRYNQTWLGRLWVVIQPLIMMMIYYFIFGVVLKLKTGEVPFPLFLLGGILVWQVFSNAAGGIANSLIGSSHLINKIYFPRLVIPVSHSMSGLVDFAFSFVVLLGFMAVMRHPPTWLAPLSLVFVALAMAWGLGMGLWFAPLRVRYPDLQHLVPLILQVMLYLSPVFYAPSVVPERYQVLYYANPTAGIIQGFRWTLMGDEPPALSALTGLVIIVVALISGLYFFRREESALADRL